MLSGILANLAGAAGRSQQLALPLFPLKTVLFPGGRLPLRVFETRYMDMVKECLRDDKAFGICAITQGEEVGAPATYAPVGTVARIASWDMRELGILSLVTEGGSRFNVTARETTPAGLAIAEVKLLDEEDPAAAPAPPGALVELLEKLIERVGERHFTAGRHFDDPNWVSYRLAEILPLKLSLRQKLLEVNDSAVRLRVIGEFLKLQGAAPR